MEQFDPAGRVAPQALAPVESAKSLGLAPVMLGTMLFSVLLPVFDNVAAIAAEVVPLNVLGKVTGVLSEADVAAAAMEIEVLVAAVNPLADADRV
jgi:hypothetical protein